MHFSAFWEEAYLRHFDGSSVLAPIVHAGLDISLTPHTWSYSFTWVSCLWVPTSSYCIPNTCSNPPWCWCNYYSWHPPRHIQGWSHACRPEGCCSCNQHNKGQLTQDLTSKLVDIFSHFDCLQMPTATNILKLCECTGSYVYIQRPYAAINEVRKGIPQEHFPFWSAKGVRGLYGLYIALTATPSKVLEKLDEPIR